MISYEPFWQTIKNKNISTYKLIKDFHISSSTLSRLRNNKSVSTATLDDLCNILNCEIEEIAKHIKQNS